jgi:hypothetical protein
VIVVRLFGVEVLAVGTTEPDGPDLDTFDNTAGSFELAEAELAERDHDVYLSSKRQRPAIVAIGSRYHRAATAPPRAFGFRPKV